MRSTAIVDGSTGAKANAEIQRAGKGAGRIWLLC